MILIEANACSKDYDEIWVLPTDCENPMENYILIYGNPGDYTLKYKDLESFKFKQSPASSPNLEFSEKFDEICKKYNIKILIDWRDFNANYGLEDISKCRQDVKVNPLTKSVEYELEEILETTDRYVFERESGETVYEVYPNADDEEYVNEIEEHFNIMDSEKLWNIRNQIQLQVF